MNASVRECIENFDRIIGRATDEAGTEQVHDLRVAIRRLREALKLAGQPAEPTLKKRLSKLMDLCGSVRNCDVTLEHFGERFQELRESMASQRIGLAEELSAYLKLHSGLLRAIPVPSSEAQPELVTDRINQLSRNFHKHARKAARAGAELDQLHRARIEAKKLRYCIELAKPDSSAAAEEWLRRFRKIQTRLGEINDSRTILNSIPETAKYRRTRAALLAKQRRKIEAFRRMWKKKFPARPKRFAKEMLEAAA